MKLNSLKYLILFISLGFTTLYAEGLLYKNRDMVMSKIDDWDFTQNDWDTIDAVYKEDKEIVMTVLNGLNSVCVMDDIPPQL